MNAADQAPGGGTRTALVSAVALGGVCLLAVWMKPERIQTDVQRRVQETLADTGFTWALASADGRDVTLWGPAPDAASAHNALAVAASVWGVRSVRDGSVAARAGETGTEPVLRAIAMAVRAMRPGTAPEEDLLARVRQLEQQEDRASIQAPRDAVLDAIRSAVSAMRADGTALVPVPTAREQAAAARRLDADTCQRLLDALLAAQPVLFDTGSAMLRPQAGGLLEQVATVAVHCLGSRLEIAGHTDAAGDRRRNITLSGERARAVMAYLAARGVSAARMSAVGYGSSAPVADNATPEGRARNRRIQITVLAGEAS